LDDYVSEFNHLVPFGDRQFTYPSLWGSVVVTDLDVFPSSTYYVVAECNGYSSQPGIDTTWLWGDVDHDNDVDAIDITHVINNFKGLPGALPNEPCDLFPCLPNGIINALDIATDVNAFKGFPYYCDPPCHP
jgi:hypothetical protein